MWKKVMRKIFSIKVNNFCSKFVYNNKNLSIIYLHNHEEDMWWRKFFFSFLWFFLSVFLLRIYLLYHGNKNILKMDLFSLIVTKKSSIFILRHMLLLQNWRGNTMSLRVQIFVFLRYMKRNITLSMKTIVQENNLGWNRFQKIRVLLFIVIKKRMVLVWKLWFNKWNPKDEMVKQNGLMVLEYVGPIKDQFVENWSFFFVKNLYNAANIF